MQNFDARKPMQSARFLQNVVLDATTSLLL